MLSQSNIFNMLEKLDSTTYNHSMRVMLIALEIETTLRLDGHKLSEAALLHDIGKIYISPTILDKKEGLSSLERELIDLHAYIGYSILHGFDIDEDICRIILYHHGSTPITISPIEKYNSEEIYEKAKMLHTIDVFEALTSDRPYHRGMSAKDALSIMKDEKGYHKDVYNYISDMATQSDNINSAVHRKCLQETAGKVTNIINHLMKIKIVS